MHKSTSVIRYIFISAILLRILLYSLPNLQSILATRPEFVTSISSFRRIQESVYLYDKLGSPYIGDVFHQQPLVFALFYPIFQFPDTILYSIACTWFIFIDIVIALGLVRLCRKILKAEEGGIPMHNGQEIWLNQRPLSPLFMPENLPFTIAFIYLFNPYTVASTIAMNTISLTHMAIIYSLVFAAEGAPVSSGIWVAVGTYLSIYPVVLLVPIQGLLKMSGDPTISSNFSISNLLVFISSTIWFSALLLLSLLMCGNWAFLNSTYIWVYSYTDLTPNIGIFWYFFMEVFDRFIPYFRFVLHVHPLIYILPLFFRLGHRPQAYACTLVGIFMLFQAFPSFGDFGLFLSLLCIHAKTIMAIPFRYMYALGIGAATCMLPVMWFIWLFPGSGNANFFYNQTLIYQACTSQVIIAFVRACMLRDKEIQVFRKNCNQELNSQLKYNSSKLSPKSSKLKDE